MRITEAELRAMLDIQAAAEQEGVNVGAVALLNVPVLVAEVRRLRWLVDEAGRLQAINRSREGRYEIVYSTLIEAEARAIREESSPNTGPAAKRST